jgi:hypothetical protein
MKTLLKISLASGICLLFVSKFSPEITSLLQQLFELVVVILGFSLFVAYVICIESAGRKTFGKRDWAMLSKRMDRSKKHRKLSDKTKRRLRKKAIGF